jgi:hypothetical protein
MGDLQARLGAAVPEAVALQAGVRYVSTADAIDLGFAGFGAATLRGLAFPYQAPGAKTPELWRLRLDEPHNGRRYLAPIGSSNRLYLPLAQSHHLTDARYDAWITEGEKKTLALHATLGQHALVIGLAGVWNWRTSDKVNVPTADHPGTETKTRQQPAHS